MGLWLAVASATAAGGDHPASTSTSSDTGPFPPAVDLRPAFEKWALTPRLQGNRPTCSAFVVTGALEFAVAEQQTHATRLSVEFLNWAANKVCGDTEDGGFFSDLWKGFAAYGICAEPELPYQPDYKPAVAPPAAALADAQARLALGLRLNWIKPWDVNTGLTAGEFLGIKRTMRDGWPVCGGFRWPKQEAWVNDVLQMCATNAVRDGHSVLLVGYRDEPAQPGGGVFLFRNTAHEGRDGFMPYAYAQAYMNDAAWVDYPAHANPRTAASAGAAGP